MMRMLVTCVILLISCGSRTVKHGIDYVDTIHMDKARWVSKNFFVTSQSRVTVSVVDASGLPIAFTVYSDGREALVSGMHAGSATVTGVIEPGTLVVIVASEDFRYSKGISIAIKSEPEGW